MEKKQVNRSNKNKSKKTQRGGTSSACTIDYATKVPAYGGGEAANIHNSNPQASLDLDNKSMPGYGGPVPFGSNIVGGARKNNKKNKNNNNGIMYKGGASCGSEGVGTGNPKSNTFKNYLNSLDSSLSSPMSGGEQHLPSPNSKPQVAGGYSTDISEFIGGRPVYKAYDDNSPPALINGSLVFGSPDQPVCGPGAISGGARRLRKKSRSKKHKNSKGKSNKRSRKHMKSMKSMKSKKQRGGDFTAFHNSKPAAYEEAFNGPPGYFKYPDNMSERDFTGRQPDYGVKTL